MYKIILLCLAFLSSLAVAQDPKLFALHVNGINVTSMDADKNLNKLYTVTQNPSKMIFKTVYNPTKTPDEWTWLAKIKGAIDVWKQKWYENHSIPSSDEVVIKVMKAMGFDYPIDSKEYKEFRSSLIGQVADLIFDSGGKNMKTIIDNFHNKVPFQFAGVLNLISNDGLTDYSKSKDYVILLPHSQGNLYANKLYTYLTKLEHFNSEHITIFGFASPAKTELGQMRCNSQTPNYITSSNDGIIEAARHWTTGEILPSNITIPNTEADKYGHALIAVYLNNMGTVKMMNNFIFITSNNCFKDTHKVERVSTLPNLGARIVYDKKINSIVQINQKQLCAYKLNSSDEWKCNPIKADLIDATSLSTNNNGIEYFLAKQGGQWVLFAYEFDKGIIKTIELSEDFYVGTPTKFHNGKIYYLLGNKLIILNVDQGSSEKLNIFDGITNNLSLMDIDSKENIYIAPIDTKDLKSTAQVYYQEIGENKPIHLFMGKTGERVMFGMSIQNNILYLCGAANLYYDPLESGNNVDWNKLDFGCKQIISDDQYLYFTTWGGELFKYNY